MLNRIVKQTIRDSITNQVTPNVGIICDRDPNLGSPQLFGPIKYRCNGSLQNLKWWLASRTVRQQGREELKEIRMVKFRNDLRDDLSLEGQLQLFFFV